MSLSKPLTLRHLCHLLNNILGLFYHRHIVFFTISLVKNTKCYLPKKSAKKRGKKLRKTHVRDRNLTQSRIYRKAEFDRMPNVPKCRSVDWTHDMIIVKWHLLIWHERKFCALTNRPPAQSTRTGQLLSTLFHVNCSAAQVYILHPWQFIFALSCKRRSVLQVFLSS